MSQPAARPLIMKNRIAVRTGVGINGERLGRTTYIELSKSQNKRTIKRKLYRQINREMHREMKMNKEKKALLSALGTNDTGNQDGSERSLVIHSIVDSLQKDIKNDLQVVVKFEQQEFKMTEEDGFKLSASVRNAVLQENILRGPKDKKDQLGFIKMDILMSGVFLIFPANVETRHWLLNTWVPPTINDRKLCVTLANHVPDVFTVYIKVREEKSADIDHVMDLLAVQNQDIGCGSWKFVSKTPQGVFMLLVFDISQESRFALEKTNWTIYYELQSYEVKFYNRHSSIFKS